MVVRRYHAILLGIMLLLSGAVSYSSREPLVHQIPQPDMSFSPQRPWIALTFDDGPHPIMTERLVNVLKQEGVPGTFFVVGKMAVRYPGIVQVIAREGNEVANHTFSHPNISKLDNKTLLNELGQTKAIIRKLTGQDSVIFRPPGGDYSRRTLRVASKAGYHMVLWTVLTKDVNGASVDLIRHRILHNACDGAIVLMHSGMPNTVEILPSVIEELRREGYHFVTVSQLMGFDQVHSGVHPMLLPESPADRQASNAERTSRSPLLNIPQS
jgi:peptidoglycan/xylan/chitin deacetylase (PgdA/CDA1 family)